MRDRDREEEEQSRERKGEREIKARERKKENLEKVGSCFKLSNFVQVSPSTYNLVYVQFCLK